MKENKTSKPTGKCEDCRWFVQILNFCRVESKDKKPGDGCKDWSSAHAETS